MRRLIVVADDFGIGPETSRGILDLAVRGRISATVLLVNSPHAEAAVTAWRRCRAPLELGWHPCLTLDGPILPPGEVPSLVDPAGRFHSLPRFLFRLLRGAIKRGEMAAELSAQHQRFIALVGQPPSCVNCHHHLHCFPAVGRVLADILRGQKPLPYVRRVREPWPVWRRVPGARGKRLMLSLLGRWTSAGAFPGSDCTIPLDDRLRALDCTPGAVVELVCHPGHFDPSIAGRDSLTVARAQEWHLLAGERFREVWERAGFVLTAPAAVAAHARRASHAA